MLMASIAVSKVQCVMLGVHSLPLSAAEPTLFASMTLSRSRTRLFTASAIAELLNSSSASTPWSSHWRAIPAPMSALFWWSAVRTSTCRPRLPAVSAIACRAQAIEPAPPR